MHRRFRFKLQRRIGKLEAARAQLVHRHRRFSQRIFFDARYTSPDDSYDALDFTKA
jgi:hypothetical protein